MTRTDYTFVILRSMFVSRAFALAAMSSLVAAGWEVLPPSRERR